jgi:hypothetical protein
VSIAEGGQKIAGKKNGFWRIVRMASLQKVPLNIDLDLRDLCGHLGQGMLPGKLKEQEGV